jgi:hypothetical protein
MRIETSALAAQRKTSRGSRKGRLQQARPALSADVNRMANANCIQAPWQWASPTTVLPLLLARPPCAPLGGVVRARCKIPSLTMYMSSLVCGSKMTAGWQRPVKPSEALTQARRTGKRHLDLCSA